MAFDVVICTYNRKERATSLLRQVIASDPSPENVIVVDSSDESDKAAFEDIHEKVRYQRSSHKNQPYQRYLGYLASESDQIIYLDDDVQILDNTIFGYLIQALERPGVEGACIRVRYENVLHDLLKKKEVKQGLLSRIVNKISGVPSPATGRLGLAGVPGPLPNTDAEVEFFQGTNMAFSKLALARAFDERVFAQYECKLGKGEDKVISFKISTFGTLWFVDKEVLHHPPVETAYFDDTYAFSKRLAFSRYFLTKVWCEGRKFPQSIGMLHYYYFMLWRIVLAALSYARSRKPGQQDMIRGLWKGMSLAAKGKKAYEACCLDWEEEARRDIEGR